MDSSIAATLRSWQGRVKYTCLERDDESAYVLQATPRPGYFVRMLRGSRITMEQTRIDEGFWVPERVQAGGSRRARGGDPMSAMLGFG